MTAPPDQEQRDAEQLSQAIGPLPEPVSRPALVVVIGLPGSGKSYFCQRLIERTPLALLESDFLRKVLFPQPTHSAAESNRLFAAIHHLIEALLRRGVGVLFDATNLSEYFREHLYHIADQARARLVLVRVEAPEAVVEERLEHRAADVARADHSDADVRVYRRMRRSLQPIRRPHFAVDSSRDITPVLDKVVHALRR